MTFDKPNEEILIDRYSTHDRCIDRYFMMYR